MMSVILEQEFSNLAELKAALDSATKAIEVRSGADPAENCDVVRIESRIQRNIVQLVTVKLYMSK